MSSDFSELASIAKAALDAGQAAMRAPGSVRVAQGATFADEQLLPLSHYVRDRELLKVAEKLYADGYHARAVEEGSKLLINVVKRVSGRKDLDGAPLMNTVFSPKNPVLKLNALQTQSERDEQQGYMQILAGVAIGVRNPRAHEHDWEDSDEHALQLLVMLDHLMVRVKAATKP